MKILPKATNMGTYKMELKNFYPHVATIHSILQEKKYNSVVNGERICNEISSDIILEDVSFSYGHAKMLQNVSITITKGLMTALVGHSGSGKSTIASILLRLYDPSAGRIIINGFDLKDYDVNTYRDIVGYVSQDPFVFNASIRENILFGGEFSDPEVIELLNWPMHMNLSWNCRRVLILGGRPGSHSFWWGEATDRYCPGYDPST